MWPSQVKCSVPLTHALMFLCAVPLAEVLGRQNSVVQAVLQMGFQHSLVESLVQSHYLLTGSHYTSVSDLVTDVLQAEEEERQTGEPRPGVSKPSLSIQQISIT